MSVINFRIADAKILAVDADTNFTSDEIRFDKSHDWSVTLVGTGIVGGPPTYTVEVSNDKTKWYDWDVSATDVALADSAGSDHLGYKYMRIVYTAGTTSAGTIAAQLGLFNRD